MRTTAILAFTIGLLLPALTVPNLSFAQDNCSETQGCGSDPPEEDQSYSDSETVPTVELKTKVSYFNAINKVAKMDSVRVEVYDQSGKFRNGGYADNNGLFKTHIQQSADTTAKYYFKFISETTNVDLEGCFWNAAEEKNSMSGNNYSLNSQTFSIKTGKSDLSAWPGDTLINPESKTAYISTSGFASVTPPTTKSYKTGSWWAMLELNGEMKMARDAGGDIPPSEKFTVGFNCSTVEPEAAMGIKTTFYDVFDGNIYIPSGGETLAEHSWLHEGGHALVDMANTMPWTIPLEYYLEGPSYQYCFDEDTGWNEVMAYILAGLADWNEWGSFSGSSSNEVFLSDGVSVSESGIPSYRGTHWALRDDQTGSNPVDENDPDYDLDCECGGDDAVMFWGIGWAFDLVDTLKDTGFKNITDTYNPITRSEMVKFLLTSNDSNDRDEFYEHWIDLKSDDYINKTMKLNTIYEPD